MILSDGHVLAEAPFEGDTILRASIPSPPLG